MCHHQTNIGLFLYIEEKTALKHIVRCALFPIVYSSNKPFQFRVCFVFSLHYIFIVFCLCILLCFSYKVGLLVGCVAYCPVCTVNCNSQDLHY